MMSGLIPFNSRQVLINDKPIRRAKICYVFQNYRDSLFPRLSALDNIAYSLKVKMNATRNQILVAKVMSASWFKIFKDVLFWESLPQTFIGLRSGISIALVIVIVAEMFIGTEQGLGKRIIDAQQVLNVKDMYASILITGILGYALNALLLLIEKRFIHWSGK